MEPELISNHGNGETIQFGSDAAEVVVYVHVDDEDEDDEIEMIWLLSEDGHVSAEPIDDRTQQVRLPYDLDLHGQVLQCSVSDGVNPRVVFDWTLEVLP